MVQRSQPNNASAHEAMREIGQLTDPVQEALRRMIAEFGDEHYHTCPADNDSGACNCFAGILSRNSRKALEESMTSPSQPTSPSVDALRYRRLRVLGCAPAYTSHLKDGDVLRFTNLDEFVDTDLKTVPTRGEAKPASNAFYTEHEVRAAVKDTIQKMMDSGELIDNRATLSAFRPPATSPSVDAREAFLEEVRNEIVEIAEYYTASFSGLPTGEDVAEWLTNDLWPNIAERFEAKQAALSAPRVEPVAIARLGDAMVDRVMYASPKPPAMVDACIASLEKIKSLAIEFRDYEQADQIETTIDSLRAIVRALAGKEGA
jgi:hypothetical protein